MRKRIKKRLLVGLLALLLLPLSVLPLELLLVLLSVLLVQVLRLLLSLLLLHHKHYHSL